ncbi:MAG: acetylxylan esterase [Planctomycetota bacterium]|nr:acetylxylan esterase [Planctomycetota bacterium]
MNDAAGRRRIEALRGYLRPSPEWDAWLEKSGELPPDFDALRSVPNLPEPLRFGGTEARSPRDWPATRERILEAFRRWVIGSYPETPGNVAAETLEEHAEPDGSRVREVLLTFGPERRARLHAQLALPPGPGPFPVFMTQRNHYGWGRVALARGYAAAIYDGCDGTDDTQAFKEHWPEHDWSMLCRRAWGGGRVLDWLHTLPEIDRRNACITGHSRNGKLSLIAGAIDARFTAVISSSSGIGGACPYRFANEAQFSEGIELITFNFKEWFHPRLRFFAGREDRLPVDANLLLALSAPRAVLVSTALNDPCESARANELAVDSAQAAWKLQGADAAEKLRLLYRWGEHEVHAEDLEAYLDWCDLHFGRAGASEAARIRGRFGETRFYPYRYEAWRARGDEDTAPEPQELARPPASIQAWEAGREERRARIEWLLGEAPPSAARKHGPYGREAEYASVLLHRPGLGAPPTLVREAFSFGEYVSGHLYAPRVALERARAGGPKLPLAVWLQPESVASGYSAAYTRGERLPAPLARAGFAVLAFDAIGNGGRIQEGARFYERYPRWSLLGKQVHDARRAVDAARELEGVDPERIFLVGFGLGGMAALLAGALDQRVAGVASACGFSPFRAERPAAPSGGLARYALWDAGGLLPRLGRFAGEPSRVPIDFDEILALLAPRPLLCVTPRFDREADFEAVQCALDRAAGIYALYGAGPKLWRHAPDDHRRYGPELQAPLHAALRRAAGR